MGSISEKDRIREKQGKLVKKFWDAIKQYPEVEKSKWFSQQNYELTITSNFSFNDICSTVDYAQKQYEKEKVFVNSCIELFPSVDAHIKENKREFEKFFDNPTIFFVVDDLLEIKSLYNKQEYCCGINFKLMDDPMSIEASYFSSKAKYLKENVFNYIDYTIRPMEKKEFNEIYIPERLIACDFSDECKALNFLKDMQDLWAKKM